MISIVYLSCYRVYNDLFKRIPALLSPVEYSVETDISGDDVRNGKYWELECIVDYIIRHGKTHYLIRWKKYRPKYNKWLKTETLKHTAHLVENYYEHFRRKEELHRTREKRRNDRRKQDS